MRPTLYIALFLGLAVTSDAASLLFDDTFEHGNSSPWELMNCTLAVDNDGSHYLHGFSTYETACNKARLTRRFADSGWVHFQSYVTSNWLGVSYGYPRLVYTDGDRVDTTIYHYWEGDGYRTVPFYWENEPYVHRFSSGNNAMSYAVDCFPPRTYEMRLHRLRAVLLEESDKLDFGTYFSRGMLESTSRTVTHTGVPAGAGNVLIVHVAAEQVWDVAGVSVAGTRLGSIDRGMQGTLNEHCWVFELGASDTPQVELTMEFYDEVTEFGPGELTVFTYDPGAVSVKREAPWTSLRRIHDPRRLHQEARFYDIAGRVVQSVPQGLYVGRSGTRVQRMVRLW